MIEEGLKRGTRKEWSPNGRPFQIKGPTTEKVPGRGVHRKSIEETLFSSEE